MTKATYASLQEELDTILTKLQEPGIDVDTAVKLFARGQEVALELEEYLKSAENKITKLKIDLEGK